MVQKISERIGFSRVRSNQKIKKRRCNLCGHHFNQHSSFERFCGRCKGSEELLRFSNWLPEIDETLKTRLSA